MIALQFEREIREQPDAWRRVARSDAAARLARAITPNVVLVGSGSSLFVAQLGAKALRRRGVYAHALAATEAFNDHAAYRDTTVIAISQSGRSSDLLDAIDALQPATLVALTNTAASPLAERASVAIDVLAGPEHAIPATKSVSGTVVALLSAASLIGGDTESRSRDTLFAAAHVTDRWFEDTNAQEEVHSLAASIAPLSHVIFLGTDYGAPIAREAALKFKESTYMHAEGFEAGEFRHGSAAMIDHAAAIVGISDDDGSTLVGRSLGDVSDRAGAVGCIGTGLADMPQLGPRLGRAWTTLAWLVAAQSLALRCARLRGVESDTPRGLRKAMVKESDSTPAEESL